MDEDAFNMEIRRFLKQVGVTTQREIERAKASQESLPNGAITITATIAAPEIGLTHTVEGQLKISG